MRNRFVGILVDYCNITNLFVTALRFTNDLKLAHYVKIPPRHTFFAQMVATLVSTFVCIGVLNFQSTIEDVCQPTQKNHYTYVAGESFRYFYSIHVHLTPKPTTNSNY